MIPSGLFKTVPIPYEKFGVHARVCCPNNRTENSFFDNTEKGTDFEAIDSYEYDHEYIDSYEYEDYDYTIPTVI